MKYPLPQHMHISIMDSSLAWPDPVHAEQGLAMQDHMDRCLDAALVADQKEGREADNLELQLEE